MSSFSQHGFNSGASPLSNSTFLFLPNLLMKWTMEYADSMSGRRRSKFLRTRADVEANMDLEGGDQLMRVFAREDGNDEDDIHDGEVGTGPSGTNRSTGKRRGEGEVVKEEGSSGIRGCEQRLAISTLCWQHGRRQQRSSPKIERDGLRYQTRCRTASVCHSDVGRELPPTSEELTALEAESRLSAVTIEELRLWTRSRLHCTPPRKTAPSTTPDHEANAIDLGWPLVEDLFIDLPEPVTPVFYRKDLSSSIRTIWNRELNASPAPKTGPDQG